MVYVHVSAEGQADGRFEHEEFVRAYTPIEVAGEMRTAIAWTTSASVCAVIEMVRDGSLPAQGFLKQEKVSLTPFLQTRTGRLYEGG